MDAYDDEAMAMVYVGDVYSLVVQDGSAVKLAKRKDPKRNGPEEEDSLWPFIR